MADQNPTDRDTTGSLSPAAEDLKVEQAMLALLLDEHPDQLTLSELSLALNGPSPDFSAEDGTQIALRELTGVGLLHRSGDFVVPSRAALHFDRLLGG
jgi:hypothetical protein